MKGTKIDYGMDLATVNSIISRTDPLGSRPKTNSIKTKIFVLKHSCVFGPYNLDKIKLYLSDELISLTDLAWKQGGNKWLPLGQILDQFSEFKDFSKPTSSDQAKFSSFTTPLHHNSSQLSNQTLHIAHESPSLSNGLEKKHSLPLAIFNEIERVEARLAKYDENDKNKKPMMKSMERLGDTLSELGYEREKLFGAKYIEGKNYEARFIPSKDPAHKTPTITRVYKPSIFYNDKLIQRGEIEVSECG